MFLNNQFKVLIDTILFFIKLEIMNGCRTSYKKFDQWAALLYQRIDGLKIEDTLASYVHFNSCLKFLKLLFPLLNNVIQKKFLLLKEKVLCRESLMCLHNSFLSQQL